MEKLPIQNVLDSLLMRYEERWHVYLKQNWRTIIGDLHTRVCLENIQGSTLLLGVYDVHWMHELYLLSSVLIDTVNAQLEKPYVKQVRFSLAVPRSETKKPKQVVVRPARRPQRRALTAQHEQALAQIKDTELQRVMQQLLQLC
jgi:hypothetical protein